MNGKVESRRREKVKDPRIRWEVLREMEKREEFGRGKEDLIEGVQQEGFGKERK